MGHSPLFYGITHEVTTESGRSFIYRRVLPTSVPSEVFLGVFGAEVVLLVMPWHGGSRYLPWPFTNVDRHARIRK